MKNLNICWAGQRVSDAVSLLDRLNVSMIVSCDYGQTGEAIRNRRRIPIISFEERLQCRKQLSVPFINHAFREILASQEFLSATQKTGPLTILPYANRPSLERLAMERRWRVLGPSVALRQDFDDKRLSRAIFQSLNIPLVACRQMPFRKLEAEIGRSRPEAPLVVKNPFSNSGAGVYLVHGPEDLSQISDEAKTGEFELLVEPFVDSYSLNVNAVASAHGTIIAPVSLQIIGADSCCSNPFGYCGNDFASVSLAPEAVRQACYDITDRLGEVMARRGYRGVFGVDFLTDSAGVVHPVEFNARFQNSTTLIDALLIEAGRPTIAELHVLACLDAEEDLRQRAGLLCEPPVASQVIVHNRRDAPFVKIAGAVREGVYRWDDASRELEYRRDALSIRECSGDEILIGSSLPPSGFKVERRAVLCRIQSRQRFLSDDLRGLRPAITNCALALERDLALEAVE
ncbi:MAG: hypothetical protein AB7U82_11835 [Blastocatellales bacterium]